MKKWEYITFRKEEIKQKQLNDLGDNGWELVTVSDGIVYLKRPKIHA